MKSMLKKTILKINDLRVRNIYVKNIKKVKIKNRIPEAPGRKEHKAAWKKLTSMVFPYWYDVYSHMTGEADPYFLPEDINRCYVEPKLNFRPNSRLEDIKSFYHRLYPEFTFPQTYFANENGVLFHGGTGEVIKKSELEEYVNDLHDVSAIIVKPSFGTGGGLGVEKYIRNEVGQFVSCKNKEVFNLNDIKNMSNHIVQEAIVQHPYLASFNESSVNTFRLITYRSVKDDNIRILHTVLRIGAPGAFIDNYSTGGAAVGVSEDGKIAPYVNWKSGEKLYEVNGNKLSNFAPIPFISKIHEVAKRFSNKFRYSRVLGLDLTVNNRGEIVILEANTGGIDVDSVQMSSGSFYGKYTEEVIEFCSKNTRTFSFYITAL